MRSSEPEFEVDETEVEIDEVGEVDETDEYFDLFFLELYLNDGIYFDETWPAI